MPLSAIDKENIEVLEALDIGEQSLHLLLTRYFAYRVHRKSPSEALEHAIRWKMSQAEIERFLPRERIV